MRSLINIMLLVVLVLAGYWFWKQPEMREDTAKVEEAIADLPDKAIDAAAKISNRIEDAPEKTEEAWENAKENVQETKDNIQSDFEDAKKRDRELQQQQP